MIKLDEKSLNNAWEDIRIGSIVYKVTKRGEIYPATVTELNGKLGQKKGGSYSETSLELLLKGEKVYNNKITLSAHPDKPLKHPGPDFFPNYSLARAEAIKRTKKMVQATREEMEKLLQQELAFIEQLEFYSTPLK